MSLRRPPGSLLFALFAVAVSLLLSACDGLRRKSAEPSSAEATDAYAEGDAAAWEETAIEDASVDLEGDRTDAMEAKADELRATYDEALADATTDDERLRAYEEFESGRQELNAMAEDEDAADDEYGPPPAP